MGIEVIFIRSSILKITIQLKGYIISDNIFYIIIGKFYNKVELNLVILLIICKNLEINLHGTILSFALVINLRIKGY